MSVRFMSEVRFTSVANVSSLYAGLTLREAIALRGAMRALKPLTNKWLNASR